MHHKLQQRVDRQSTKSLAKRSKLLAEFARLFDFGNGRFSTLGWDVVMRVVFFFEK